MLSFSQQQQLFHIGLLRLEDELAWEGIAGPFYWSITFLRLYGKEEKEEQHPILQHIPPSLLLDERLLRTYAVFLFPANFIQICFPCLLAYLLLA